ncbi:MAG TPA: serine hydrolase [Pirellulales bacterium]|nr:serine hydrolase [Pirellulales bacterium]
MRTASAALAIVLVAACATAIRAADDYSPDVQKRITAVEQGLIPAVRIKGRSQTTKICDRMTRDHVPAVSVAVINGGRIEWAKAYGLADAVEGTPATVDTLFQAASMSKPITALAALKLVEQGKLELDENVNRKLRSWQLPENEFTEKHAVDLRGLLSHTAGLTIHGFPGYEVDAPLPTVPQILDGQPPANTAAVRVNKVPGHGFRYSGGGTTMAQLLMCDVTDRPFPDLMHDLVLAPFGMSKSTFAQPLPADRAAQAARAHNEKGERVKGGWHVYPEMGPAGLWTTPSDMCRYMIAVQQAQRGTNDRVLKRTMLDEMLKPQGGGPVGLGPFIVERDGAKRFEHSGGNEGFRCNFIAFLDRDQGAVVMTNADSGNRAVNELMNSIALVYGWPGFVPPEREAASVSSESLDRLVGDYALNVASVATISRRGEQLFVKLPRQPELELHTESATRFFSDDPDFSGACVLDDAGQVASITFQFGTREVSARRVK